MKLFKKNATGFPYLPISYETQIGRVVLDFTPDFFQKEFAVSSKYNGQGPDPENYEFSVAWGWFLFAILSDEGMLYYS